MILIIDDDSAVRSSLSFMLKRAGYEAQTVPGPREAMEVVRSVAPDLILMDMNFTLSTTGEEGLTLLKQVKIFRPETPVILMTAWGSIQLAVQGMQAGAFDFITKPWNNAALLQRIETALQLSGTPQEPTQEQSDSFDRSHIIGRSQGLMAYLPSYMWNVNGWLAEKLGLKVTSQTQKCIPQTHSEDIFSSTLNMTVKAGDATGMSAVVTTNTEEGIVIESECIGKVYSKEEYDKNIWTVEGEPNTTIVVEKPATVELTCATIVNRLPDVVNAKAGYLPTERIGELNFKIKPLNEYVK